ncbi:XshC-Cox1 family protein [Streptomyces sp. TR1341]|uniref:Xanthine dehydrogenase accessory factor n=1 Tax=Streptomyces murinus TaxID=33900 RepID=A0A7W3NVY0_STRMR|nr:XdhC/CoxI family protein [Streptomyces murinus]MBA9057684.1 xanthine dehydrogenase accessory factor [Streptomyces murinus]NDK23212.1 XshC-Cox1 family protein [Streptomyces sp. TR1341]UWW91938.1 XshC-Cox1 family protein [Streptomyces murinus]WSI89242.1 XdhC family protein [Streptomyces murinus]
MRDIAQGLSSWSASGKRFAVATVVRTWKSAPRQAGSSLAVAEDGEVIGSVSGGCVEGAVYELASEVLESGEPALVTYGVSDDDALAVGLTCGGIIEILVRPAGADRFPGLPGVLEAMDAGRPVAVVSPLPDEGGGAEPDPTAAPAGQMIVTPSGAQGTLGDPRLDAAVVERAQGLLAQGSTGVVRVGRAGEERRDDVAVFVESFAPPPRMLVFGAIDFASAVARIGKFLGYHVTVCDARPVFATRRRFPDADELVVDWPHRYLESTEVDENTVICVLTHDPKFDVPLLQRALRTPARYIGAMGSRRTHEDRLRRLREEGMTEAELSRLSAPIGLDLGARTPEETAVAIMAEVIALRWGGTGRRLVEMTPLPIHR